MEATNRDLLKKFNEGKDADGGGSAEGEKKTPKKALTEAEKIARGILWDLFCQITRWDRKCDFNSDPGAAPESNVFDSHCHIDRMFGNHCGARFKELRNSNNRFYEKFEGCITSFCDLNWIEVHIIYNPLT